MPSNARFFAAVTRNLTSHKLILNQICTFYKDENSLNNVDEVITTDSIIYVFLYIDHRICHKGRDFGLWLSMSHLAIRDVPYLRHLSNMTFHYFELLGSSKSFTLTRSVINFLRWLLHLNFSPACSFCRRDTLTIGNYLQMSSFLYLIAQGPLKLACT